MNSIDPCELCCFPCIFLIMFSEKCCQACFMCLCCCTLTDGNINKKVRNYEPNRKINEEEKDFESI